MWEERILEKLEDITKMDQLLDAEFPFRLYERQCEDGTWALRWKRLLVDQDYMANLADQMHVSRMLSL